MVALFFQEKLLIVFPGFSLLSGLLFQHSTFKNQHSTFNHQPPTINHQPSTINQQPSTKNQKIMRKAIAYLSTADSIFKTIVEKWGLPQIPSRSQGFETLALLILEQQVSIDSAKATYQKLKLQIPQFNPENILKTTDEIFRSCGVSRQKTLYIKCLANAVIEKNIDLESLPKKSAEVVRQELIQIKGIGNWTIDVYLMFCLQSPDILPLGDIAVVNTIKELLDIHTKEEMDLHAQKWAPHRSTATFLLWHHYLQKRNRKVEY